MPIQANANRVQGAAESFKETTAAFRKTGPIEKYQPLADSLKELALNGLGPIAPRVAELEQEGKNISVADIRAGEVAAKLQKGEDLNASEIAQALVAVRVALDTGLKSHDSPFYQATTTLRTQRERELQVLHDELNGYLTGEARKPYDEAVMGRRFTWRNFRVFPGIGWVPGWLSSTLHSGIVVRRPGRETYDTGETIRITPEQDEALSPANIAEAKRQSRVLEAYNNSRERIAQQKYGRSFSAVTDPRERNLIIYDAADEISYKFMDEEVQSILSEGKQGPSKELLDSALEGGSPAEKTLARKYQKLGLEGIPQMIRRSKDLAKIKTLAEYQRFLGVDDLMLSKGEIADSIAEYLGITDEKELKRFKANQNKAFEALYGEKGGLSTILFSDKLFRDKLEKFAQDREEPEIPPERKTGAKPTGLSKDALIGLSGESLALRLISGDLGKDPIVHFKELGIDDATAQKMLQEGEKYVTKRADGVYFVNEKTIGNWDPGTFAVWLKGRKVDLNDPVNESALQNQLIESYKTMRVGKTLAEREKMAKDKIKMIKDLAEITNTSLPQNQQEEILKKWDKRNLALLGLLLGPLFITRMMSLMTPSEQRGFQNMFG